jgi:hypothetical protein
LRTLWRLERERAMGESTSLVSNLVVIYVKRSWISHSKFTLEDWFDLKLSVIILCWLFASPRSYNIWIKPPLILFTQLYHRKSTNLLYFSAFWVKWIFWKYEEYFVLSILIKEIITKTKCNNLFYSINHLFYYKVNEKYL